jgi:hypothetical protein
MDIGSHRNIQISRNNSRDELFACMHIDRGRFLLTNCTQSIQEEMLRFIGDVTDETTFWDIFKGFHKLALLRKFYHLTCCAIAGYENPRKKVINSAVRVLLFIMADPILMLKS